MYNKNEVISSARKSDPIYKWDKFQVYATKGCIGKFQFVDGKLVNEADFVIYDRLVTHPLHGSCAIIFIKLPSEADDAGFYRQFGEDKYEYYNKVL